MKKIRKEKVGNNASDDLEAFSKKAVEGASKKGTLRLLCEDYNPPVITGIVFQTQSMFQLAQMYQDCIQIDSTHDVTRYLFQSFTPTGVDCFNKTVLLGITFN